MHADCCTHRLEADNKDSLEVCEGSEWLWSLERASPLKFIAGRDKAESGGVVSLTLVCLVLILFSSLEQQAIRITELARERQAAELKALKESSER